MIDLRLVGNRLFRSTTIVLFIGMAAFLGTLYLVALFFQDGLGLSALSSGLSTFPEAIGVMIGAQIATRLYPVVRAAAADGGRAGRCGRRAWRSMTLVGFSTSLWVVRGADVRARRLRSRMSSSRRRRRPSRRSARPRPAARRRCSTPPVSSAVRSASRSSRR